MNALVHGHEVLHRILNASSPPSIAELKAQLEATFGPDPRFVTCSTEGMTYAELLTFLAERGKIVIEAGRVSAFRERMCTHGEHDHEHNHEHPASRSAG